MNDKLLWTVGWGGRGGGGGSGQWEREEWG